MGVGGEDHGEMEARRRGGRGAVRGEMQLMTLVVLALGATIGAVTRYAVSLWAATRFGAAFPYGTLIVNLVGSFILGFFFASAAARPDLSPTLRLFVATGFCGSLTTFSTLSYETVMLIGDGNLPAALFNAFGSLVAGLLCVVLGAAVGRALTG